MTSVSPPPTHVQLPHPLNRRSPEARAPQYPISEQQPFKGLPRTLPAPPTSKHALGGAPLDVAIDTIIRALDNLDVADTGMFNELCEHMSNTELYARPINRQRIIQVLEVASDEISKTRAAGLWEITARVAQERHFVCPPQMEGTVKNYIRMIDTVNENLGAFEEEDLRARLNRINQSKPFQANIPANTACLFCRRRKIKCDGSLPQCDMCMKHRQAKCEYPQKSHYGGFSNRGGLHYVVPMGPDIAAAAATPNGTSAPLLMELGKAVKGYAPPATTGGAPTYILPGPAPTSGYARGDSRRQDGARRDYGSSGPAGGGSTRARGHSATTGSRSEGAGDKTWDEDDEEDETRPGSSSSSQLLQTRNGEDGEPGRRRSPQTGHERCINCDTDKTSLWRKDEDGRTICNACQIYFRVHGRKRPKSMRSSTVKKRPGRQSRPSAGHALPHDPYPRDDDDKPMARSPPSSRSHSPSPAEYVQQQQQQLRVIEKAIATGQRSQPVTTTGLDYALSTRGRAQPDHGYRGRPLDYVSAQDHSEPPHSYNRDTRGPLHPSPSVDLPMADATEDRHRRRTSDDYRRSAEHDDETEVQAGENLCAVEGGRSPADVLVFRFDADRAKSVCATQWAHLRSPNRTVEDDLRFHLNCYRKNPPDSGSQERVTLGVATDWLPKAGVYSITSGDEPPTSHHMAPPPNGKLNQTIDITSEIREGLNTLKFTQLRDMSDCVLVVQIWKVGRKAVPPAPRYSGMSPIDKRPVARAPPGYEASPSPVGVPARAVSPRARPKDVKSNGTSRRGCLYCYNNRIACRPSHQDSLSCEECIRRGIQCTSPEEYSPDLGYHSAPIDRKPASLSPPVPAVGPQSPGGSAGSKRKQEDQNGSKSKRSYKRRSISPPPAQTLPHMHHIQHVPPQPGHNPAPSDSRAAQDLRRRQEMLIKQQQDAERENARVLAGGLPTPYA